VDGTGRAVFAQVGLGVVARSSAPIEPTRATRAAAGRNALDARLAGFGFRERHDSGRRPKAGQERQYI
jgi:hypothetical protein